MQRTLVLLTAALVACSGAGKAGDGDASSPTTDAAPAGDASADAGLLPPGYVPSFDTLALRCKLISDTNIDDPTANDTHQRANVV